MTSTRIHTYRQVEGNYLIFSILLIWSQSPLSHFIYKTTIFSKSTHRRAQSASKLEIKSEAFLMIRAVVLEADTTSVDNEARS